MTSKSSGAGKHSPTALCQGHSPSNRKKNLFSMISKSSEEHLLYGHGAFSDDSHLHFPSSPFLEPVDFPFSTSFRISDARGMQAQAHDLADKVGMQGGNGGGK